MKDAILDVVGYFIPDDEVEYWNQELTKGLHKVILPMLWDACKALAFVFAIAFAVYVLLVMIFVAFG